MIKTFLKMITDYVSRSKTDSEPEAEASKDAEMSKMDMIKERRNRVNAFLPNAKHKEQEVVEDVQEQEALHQKDKDATDEVDEKEPPKRNNDITISNLENEKDDLQRGLSEAIKNGDQREVTKFNNAIKANDRNIISLQGKGISLGDADVGDAIQQEGSYQVAQKGVVTSQDYSNSDALGQMAHLAKTGNYDAQDVSQRFKDNKEQMIGEKQKQQDTMDKILKDNGDNSILAALQGRVIAAGAANSIDPLPIFGKKTQPEMSAAQVG